MGEASPGRTDAEPSMFQLATMRAWLRGWRDFYVHRFRDVLEEVSVRLSAQRLAALCPFDPAAYSLRLLKVPYAPDCQPIRLTLRDERTPRYEVAITCLLSELASAEVIDRHNPGARVIEGPPLVDPHR
jgi:hypothetical protein